MIFIITSGDQSNRSISFVKTSLRRRQVERLIEIRDGKYSSTCIAAQTWFAFRYGVKPVSAVNFMCDGASYAITRNRILDECVAAKFPGDFLHQLEAAFARMDEEETLREAEIARRNADPNRRGLSISDWGAALVKYAPSFAEMTHPYPPLRVTTRSR